jgi:hypothetical protein
MLRMTTKRTTSGGGERPPGPLYKKKFRKGFWGFLGRGGSKVVRFARGRALYI